MSRVAVLALILGGCSCGNGSKPAAEQQTGPSQEKGSGVVCVPGMPCEKEGNAQPIDGVNLGSQGLTQDKYDKALNNKQFHLRAEEATLSVPAKVEAKAGSEATAEIKLAPAAGYKVAVDFPTKLELMDTPGVKLDKTKLTAGGRAKAQGDAQTFTEQAMAFAVKATPEAAGAYEIKGVFHFGVCEKEACHPRTQPITIQVAAN